MSEVLQSLNCTQCGGAPLTDNGDGTISCPFCGAVFAPRAHVSSLRDNQRPRRALLCFVRRKTARAVRALRFAQLGACRALSALRRSAGLARAHCPSTRGDNCRATSAPPGRDASSQGRSRACLTGAAGKDVGAGARAAGSTGQSQSRTAASRTNAIDRRCGRRCRYAHHHPDTRTALFAPGALNKAISRARAYKRC